MKSVALCWIESPNSISCRSCFGFVASTRRKRSTSASPSDAPFGAHTSRTPISSVPAFCWHSAVTSGTTMPSRATFAGGSRAARATVAFYATLERRDATGGRASIRDCASVRAATASRTGIVCVRATNVPKPAAKPKHRISKFLRSHDASKKSYLSTCDGTPRSR